MFSLLPSSAVASAAFETAFAIAATVVVVVAAGAAVVITLRSSSAVSRVWLAFKTTFLTTSALELMLGFAAIEAWLLLKRRTSAWIS